MASSTFRRSSLRLSSPLASTSSCSLSSSVALRLRAASSWSAILSSVRVQKGRGDLRRTGWEAAAQRRRRGEGSAGLPLAWSTGAGGIRTFSSSSSALSEAKYTAGDLSPQAYHDASDLTLDTLTESLEELVGSGDPDVEGWDVEYSSGVLTFSLGSKGTYVINKQPPNKQIWLSSPFSGPKRYDYDPSAQVWFYSRDNSRFKEVLEKELGEVLGRKVELAVEEGDG